MGSCWKKPESPVAPPQAPTPPPLTLSLREGGAVLQELQEKGWSIREGQGADARNAREKSKREYSTWTSNLIIYYCVYGA